MSTAAADLRTIITTWPELADALTTHSADTWPPAGRMSTHLTDLGLDDTPQRGARDGSGTGDAPAPCRIDILDTQRTVHAALVELADQIAAAVQRSPMPYAPSAWPAADRARRNALADADMADPRRWRYRGTRPDTRYTALWLLARVTGRPGPFTPLAERHHRHITNVAAEAVRRIEQALQLTRLSRPAGYPCHCGGDIHIHGGDGHPPTLACTACGRSYTPRLAA